MDCPLLWGIDVPIKGLMMTAINALPVTFPTNEHQYRKSYEVTSKTRDRHRRPKRRQNDNRSHVITGTLWRFVFWTGCGMLDTFYCHWSDTSADSCDKLYTNTSTKLTRVLAPAPLLGVSRLTRGDWRISRHPVYSPAHFAKRNTSSVTDWQTNNNYIIHCAA